MEGMFLLSGDMGGFYLEVVLDIFVLSCEFSACKGGFLEKDALEVEFGSEFWE